MVVGYVYKLVDKREPDTILYIGSTKNRLQARWNEHSSRANDGTSVLCKYMKRHGVDNFQLAVMGCYRCSTLRELRKIEETQLVNHDPPLNKRSAYCVDRRLYYLRHKEAITKYMRSVVACKICGKEMKRSLLQRHRKTH
jgi:hypothetical protein